MIERFLEYILVEKRYSPHTLISYKKDLKDFSAFLLKTEAHQDFGIVDKKVIRNFIVDLSEKKIAKRSINRKLSSLRSFYLFLLKIGDIQVSPLENISSLKFYAEKQVPFSEEEMKAVQSLEIQPKSGSFLKELIVETLYQTGIRRAELVNLLLEDVDFSNKEIKVIGKGNKQRMIPLSDELSLGFQKFLLERKPLIESAMYFFINPKGKKLNDITTAEDKALDKATESDATILNNLTLEDQVNFSTVTLYLYQRETTKQEVIANEKSVNEYRPNIGLQIWDSLKTGWFILEGIIAFVMQLWSVFLIAGIGFVLYRKFLKK